jgi:hypothetical protein
MHSRTLDKDQVQVLVVIILNYQGLALCVSADGSQMAGEYLEGGGGVIYLFIYFLKVWWQAATLFYLYYIKRAYIQYLYI